MLLLVLGNGKEAMPAVMMGLAHFAPFIVVSPFAGLVVDRTRRKWILVGCDLFCLLVSVVLYALLSKGPLDPWCIYVSTALSGAAHSFRSPAYIAVTSELLRTNQYSRTNGLRYLGDSAAYIAAPVVVVGLISQVGFGGFVLADLISFVISAATIIIVIRENPSSDPASATGERTPGGGLWFGFRYIAARPGLLALSLSFFAINFLSIFSSVLPAYYVARSGRTALGATQMATSVGAIAGGLFISRWSGAPAIHRVAFLLIGSALCSLTGQLIVGISSSLVAWTLASAMTAAMFSMTTATQMTLWQAKTDSKIQGQVFSARRVIEESAGPLGMISSGVIADHYIAPMFVEGRPVALQWEHLTHDHTGMGLLLFVCGASGAAVALITLALPSVRRIDADLPDIEDTRRPVSNSVPTS